jgi:hypothetical protein
VKRAAFYVAGLAFRLRMHRRMRRQAAGIAAVLAALCAVPAAAGTPRDRADAHAECAPSHVRATDIVLQGAFELGMERSATFRALVEAIRDSDLIVYASGEQSMPTPISGEIHFLTVAGAHRYLRVFVRADLSPWARAAMLAHELQHAREIAAEPGVRDLDTMDTLYERIGYDVGVDRHETDAAREIGELVQRELTPGYNGGGTR